MSIKSQLQKLLTTLETVPQQVIRYISSAVARVFSPNDDDYPKTGVQPFKGDPSDKKSF
ncbi:hypothetical protein HJG54_28935 [Leptolyngbya sp. NK1-12]|uniref:Isochorismate synthase n=1 Tax=Leptolyngbya sp. NK1-12 TaxID=2547451 RepID=A0AA96WYB6_9CYAN|nr:hypothetical protein [Leptolyngbya sp. NK1-12]MBF2051601.1 hypothetical protein [Elainella sp. C42_A2020_010]WNZ26952.1 hypothetical protein HJG54_28935 [Leptolyngbya sp. NK1-12]